MEEKEIKKIIEEAVGVFRSVLERTYLKHKTPFYKPCKSCEWRI